MDEFEFCVRLACELLGVLVVLLIAVRYHVHLLEKAMEKKES